MQPLHTPQNNLQEKIPQPQAVEYRCLNCGAPMPRFFWGEKGNSICQQCHFKHPCCDV